ncbi:MAG: YggU family protein, partial [Candidatus Altiarchaeales archaeon]|nr:YggU family protein [Candidatus Altiarchaeales archaeon]
ISYNEWDGRLHIRIREPPEGGKANKRIVGLFSDLFGGCRVVSGKLSRKKTVEVKDTSMDRVHEKLGDIL